MRGLRHLPPTAIQISSTDLWHGLISSLDHHRALEQFRSALIEQTGSHHCYLVSSGRAALALTLMSLRRVSDRTQVVVPAYVCPTVVQSVLKAGLEPVICDVSPQTLDLDRQALSRLINPNILAVVPAHLYGWAQDVRDLVVLGKQNGFFVIEDAAQAYGAKLCGRMVGSWGDMGYFSLGRGKCIPVGHGGVIISQNWCAPDIAEIVQATITNPSSVDLKTLVHYLGYGVATRPLGWWIVTRTPWNPADAGMASNELEPISINRLSATQAGIGESILERIGQIQAISKRNARRLISLLAEFDFAAIPQIRPESEPVFLRLPVILNDEKLENKLFDRLWRCGSGVSRSYWRTIPELFPQLFVFGKNDYPGATHLARCLLTLPTHAYLRDEDLERLVSAFRSVQQR